MSAKKSQKGRKIGRNKDWCKSYMLAGKADISHVRRAYAHLMRYGLTDHKTAHWYNNTSPLAKQRAKLPMSVTPAPQKERKKKGPTSPRYAGSRRLRRGQEWVADNWYYNRRAA